MASWLTCMMHGCLLRSALTDFDSVTYPHKNCFRNSLLDQPDVAPMTNRTKERWPPADTLVEYLRDFSQEQVDAGRVVFGATIDRIERQGMQEGSILPGDHHGDFNVAITLRDEGVASAETAVRAVCGAVVVATGLPNPHVPDVPGIELAEGCRDPDTPLTRNSGTRNSRTHF